MMNRGNMGKEISTAPKSKGVKKMMMGGMADGARRPAVMPPRPGMPPSMGPGGMPRPPAGGPGFFGGGAPSPGMGPGGVPRPPAGGPGFFGPGGMGGPAGMDRAGMMAAAAEAMRNRQATGMKKGGPVKGMAKGGAAKCMATGGSVQRGDGCAMKGKTKGTMR